MNDDEYEYQIATDGLTVQVRQVDDGKGGKPEWEVYMNCDSWEQAERVLYALNHPESKENPL